MIFRKITKKNPKKKRTILLRYSPMKVLDVDNHLNDVDLNFLSLFGDFKNKSRPAECNYCTFSSKSKGDLTKHLAFKHNINVKWYKCDICEYKAKSASGIKSHKIQFHNLNVTWHFCEHCAFKAKTQNLLKKHVRCIHKPIEK